MGWESAQSVIEWRKSIVFSLLFLSSGGMGIVRIPLGP